jgi:hypothetical protein
MENNTSEIQGFILELYRNGFDEPCYVSTFDPAAVAGFNGYTPNKEEAAVFESREALLPLASIEVEAIEADEQAENEEHLVFDGFRILPFKGATAAQLVGNEELEAALEAFES